MVIMNVGSTPLQYKSGQLVLAFGKITWKQLAAGGQGDESGKEVAYCLQSSDDMVLHDGRYQSLGAVGASVSHSCGGTGPGRLSLCVRVEASRVKFEEARSLEGVGGAVAPD